MSQDAELVGERAEPAAGRGQDDVADVERAGARGRRGRDRAAAASANRVRRVRDEVSTRTVAAGLGVDEVELADVGQLVLARVADLDDEHAVALGDGGQLAAASRADRGGPRPARPARRRAAVGGERGAPGLGRLEAAGAAVGLELDGRPASRAGRRGRQSAGRRRSVGPPKVSTPRRLPRWVDRWPTAIATPSATSVLRRSAVPKAIDGETSSSSQEVSARSGTWTRTWGTVIRAVAFQSMRRTSSPGSYGRTWASSVPPPRSRARNSPGTRPRIRRPMDRSSARRSASGVGPGPGWAWSGGRVRACEGGHAVRSSVISRGCGHGRDDLGEEHVRR